MKSRIKPIDGLRMFAAFGVLWIHTWTFYGNPELRVGPFDFMKAVAILGNGVDFFFVISGFCMYLMTGGKNYKLRDYLRFLYKRFLRIAPAFYVAVIVYSCLVKYESPSFQLLTNIFYQFLFVGNFTGNVSAPFWSIGTEWQFYMILPFVILIWDNTRLPKLLLFCCAFSLLFYSLVTYGMFNYNFWISQVVVRFPEFAVGIYAAYLFKLNKPLPDWFKGSAGIIVALMIMYLGRFLKFTSFIQAAGNYGFIFKASADTVMVTGFAMLLLHVVSVRSLLSRALSHRVITYLGRISYSIYLWHSLFFLLLAGFLRRLPFGRGDVFLGFVIVSVLTILLGIISYKYLESFYFSKSFLNEKVLSNEAPGKNSYRKIY